MYFCWIIGTSPCLDPALSRAAPGQVSDDPANLPLSNAREARLSRCPTISLYTGLKPSAMMMWLPALPTFAGWASTLLKVAPPRTTPGASCPPGHPTKLQFHDRGWLSALTRRKQAAYSAPQDPRQVGRAGLTSCSQARLSSPRACPVHGHIGTIRRRTACRYPFPGAPSSAGCGTQ